MINYTSNLAASLRDRQKTFRRAFKSDLSQVRSSNRSWMRCFSTNHSNPAVTEDLFECVDRIRFLIPPESSLQNFNRQLTSGIIPKTAVFSMWLPKITRFTSTTPVELLV